MNTNELYPRGRYQTRGVLAGCYRGKAAKYESVLTHTADTHVRYGQAICGKLKGDLADEYSNPAGLNEPPTCKACLKKDPRWK